MSRPPLCRGFSTARPRCPNVRAQRVRDGRDRLGYRPFEPARALRNQLTRVWAAIIADIENPFFTAMVRGIEDVARAEGFRLVLCNSDEDLDKERAYVDIVLAERMSGVVIAVASTDDSSLQPLLDRRIPIVAVDRRPLDDRSTRWWSTTGPAPRTPPHTSSTNGWSRDRLHHRPEPRRHRQRTTRRLPRRATSRRHHRRPRPRPARRLQGGRRLPRRPIPARIPHPSRRVVRGEQSHGRRCPARRPRAGPVIARDIGLVAFDDSPWTTLTTPSLTVVAQPAYEIGRAAAELLATADPDRAAGHVVLSPTLVVRESSTPPP